MFFFMSNNQILRRLTSANAQIHYGKYNYRTGQAFALMEDEFWSYNPLPTFSFPKVSYSSDIEGSEKGILLQSELYFGQHRNATEEINVNNKTIAVFLSLSNEKAFNNASNILRLLINKTGKAIFQNRCNKHNPAIRRISLIRKGFEKMAA
uniref:COesterase domain-containing protein n=1 Tax=Strongyloides papillosus TaxID=174720 RepID=A0A0N5CHA6_STREA